MTKMTREDAERILSPYGFTIINVHATGWIIVTNFETQRSMWLPPPLIRALDPGRPLSAAQRARLIGGAIAFGLADEEECAGVLLDQLWELGAEDASS